MTATKVVQTR